MVPRKGKRIMKNYDICCTRIKGSTILDCVLSGPMPLNKPKYHVPGAICRPTLKVNKCWNNHKLRKTLSRIKSSNKLKFYMPYT